MPILKGTLNIGSVFRGTTVISKVYRGTTMIYQKQLIPQWTKQTEMNVLPVNDGWNDASSGGLAVTLNGDGTVNLNDNELLEEITNFIPNIIDSTKITRLECRVKVNNASSGALNFASYFGIRNGTKTVNIDLKTDGVQMQGTGSTKYLIDMTQYQIIRLELDKTNEARLYVNGNLVDTISYSNLVNLAVNNVLFGTVSTTLSNTDYDYIYYQLDLEANPDQ